MKLRNVTIILSILFAVTFGKDKNPGKDAVVEKEIINILVEDDSFEYEFQKRVLVKNRKGLKFCSRTLTENDFFEIEDIEAVIKDTNGTIIKELDSDDIIEESISPGNVFYSGNTYQHFKLEHFKFPFIIEYSYKVSCNTLFFWIDWYPQNSVPTLRSEYNLTVGKNVHFKTKKIGEIHEPIKKEGNKTYSYSWSLNNIEAFNREDYLPPENKTQICLMFSATEFEIDDYKGSSKSWDSFAEWYRSMTEEKYLLPEKAKKEVLKEITGIKDTTKIVSTLYKFMQKGTRYVAVEPGISGWQPHSATEVYEHRYGDCKDLSTYFIGLLNVAGIKGYPALARTSSKGKHDSSFVTNIFNHCITMVPLKKDTLWVECTSSYANVNSLPSGIEDISVLVVKENSGEFITTPQKKSSQNYCKSKILGHLGINENLHILAKINMSGNPKEYIKTNLIINSNRENLDYLKSRYGKYAANLKINNYNFDEENNKNILKFSGYYKKFSKRSGKRIFINLNLFNRIEKSDIPEEDVEERKFPVYYSYPYLYVDTVEIKLPKGYVLESKRKDTIFETPFSYYKSNLTDNGERLLYIREYEIKDNRIKHSNYEEYKAFISKVAKADKKKIILKKE